MTNPVIEAPPEFWEPGGQDYQARKNFRQLLALSKELVQTRSQEAAEMIADDWEVNVPIFPFLEAPDNHPLKSVGDKIGYMAIITPEGAAKLLRLPPNYQQSAVPAPSLTPAVPVRANFLELDDPEGDADTQDAPVPDDSIPTEEDGAYQIDGKIDPEKVTEFLSHLSLGLLTFIEKSLARMAHKKLKRIRPELHSASRELERWDNVHEKPVGARK